MPARVQDAKAHPRRARLLSLLRAQPGARLADLAFLVTASRNTVEYHLAILRRHRIIEQKGQRWFVRGDRRAASPVRAYGPGRRMVDLLTCGTSMTVTEIGGLLGLRSSHVMYHVRRFEAAGLVTTEKRGRSRIVTGLSPANPAGEPQARPAAGAGPIPDTALDTIVEPGNMV